MRFFDPGGQRNKRAKWIELFDDVSVLFFVVRLAGFDQPSDDGAPNDLLQAMSIYSRVVNRACFKETFAVLFLNKLDIFQRRIKEKSLEKVKYAFEGADFSMRELLENGALDTDGPIDSGGADLQRAVEAAATAGCAAGAAAVAAVGAELPDVTWAQVEAEAAVRRGRPTSDGTI